MSFIQRRKNNLMVPYKGITFYDFFKIMSSLPNLNEDVLRIIYQFAMPHFTPDDRCILKDPYIDYTQKVKIACVFYSNVHLTYCYSYRTKRALCMYAGQESLTLDPDKNPEPL